MVFFFIYIGKMFKWFFCCRKVKKMGNQASNQASFLQAGEYYDPIYELETLDFNINYVDMIANPPSFSFSEWKVNAIDFELNERPSRANRLFYTLLRISLDKYYQYWDSINDSNYEMTACKVFAFLLRHVSLETKTIVFASRNIRNISDIKFKLFRYVVLMIKKENDVQAIQKLKELMLALNWMKPLLLKLRDRIWVYATSTEMLKVLELNMAYSFPSTLDWLPEKSISSKTRRKGMENMVKKDRPLAMLQYFYAEKFEKTYSDTWRILVEENANQQQLDELITGLKDKWFYIMFRACIRKGNMMGLKFLLSKSPPWKTIGQVGKKLPLFIYFKGEAALKNPQMLTEILNFIDRPEWTDILDVRPFKGKVDLVYSMLAQFLKILSDSGATELYDDLIRILCIQLIVWNQPLIHQKTNPNGTPMFYQKVQKCYQDLLQLVQGKDERLFHLNHVANLMKNPQSTYRHRYPTKHRKIENKPANISHACNLAWVIYYLYHHVHDKKLVHAQHWDFSYAWHEWMLRNDPKELNLRVKS